jgi:hypothetical protein
MTRIVRDFRKLPPRIQDVVVSSGARVDDFALAMKSSYKPNATIPIIWFVVMAERLLLCNTHRSRGLWRTLQGAGLAALELHRTSLGSPFFVFNDDGGTVYITMPDGVSSDELEVLSREFSRLRTR